MTFNIRATHRDDFLLCCDVSTWQDAFYWLGYYTKRYPEFSFELVCIHSEFTSLMLQ